MPTKLIKTATTFAKDTLTRALEKATPKIESAVKSIKEFIVPTVYAPSAAPGQPGGAPLPKEQPQKQSSSTSSSNLTASLLGAFQKLIVPKTEAATQPGTASAIGATAFREATSAPSQPLSTQSPAAFKPSAAPTMPVGGFASRPPAPVGPTPVSERAPALTPTTAPVPATRPPTPTLPGVTTPSGIGGGGTLGAPVEAALPPTPVMPSEVTRLTGIPPAEIPLGQFDAMIRALQMLQAGGPARFVPTPLEGAAPFGPALAQERALRRLRERELARIL